MIETTPDIQRFVDESTSGQWILHIVPVEDGIHAADNTPSILFIKNITTEKVYYFAFDHPDSKPNIKVGFVKEFLHRPEKIKWVLDKKSFCQMLPLPNVYDANLCGFLKNNEIEEISEYETEAHNLIRRHSAGFSGINKTIPLVKHKEMFEDLCEAIEEMIRKVNIDSAFLHINDTILDTLGQIEKNGIYVDKSIFEKHFSISPNANGLVYSQYNIYTSTGRPSNRYNGVNYAALGHNDGCRASFVSRYGNDGRMVLIDYTAFHPRIICTLTDYSIPVEVDIYEYLAKLYFSKKIVDETDIANAKQLTFRQLYGGVDEKHSRIKYLANLSKFIDEQWEFFQKNGYILTPIFKRKITDNHIQEPSPTKVFNYILQAAEGEISIPKVQEVMKYLSDKKTLAVLYTYDAVLYDFHKDDGYDTLNEIRRIMSYDGKFPMKTYVGESYNDMKLITL